MATVNENEFLRESITFNEIPPEIGVYKISGDVSDKGDDLIGASYFRSEDDGDVVTGAYIVDTDGDKKSNELEITAIDTVARTVQGNFKVKFRQKPDTENTDYPTKVEFKKGCFDVTIRE
jgi:hypothetical protein